MASRPKKSKKKFHSPGMPSQGASSSLLRFLQREFPAELEAWSRSGEGDLVEFAGSMVRALQDRQDGRILDLVEKMMDLGGDWPEGHLLLAQGYLLNGLPLHAIKQARIFLERWPDHPDAEPARAQIANLEAVFHEVSGGEEMELVEARERMTLVSSRGEYDKLEQIARGTLRRYPGDPPSRNNLSLAQFQKGKFELARETALGVVGDDPENVHALGNLVRYCLVLGLREEANEWARRLKTSSNQASDRWGKVAEGLSFVGDFPGVLEAYENGKDELSPLLLHLAAVAQSRLGHPTQAIRLWEKALDLDPDFVLVIENLRNAGLPDDERFGAWPHALGHYLPVAEIERELRKVDGSKAGLDKVLDRLPSLRNLLPILLEQGRPEDVNLAVTLASASKNKEALAVLQDFAQSKHASFSLRSQAAQGCVSAGLIPSGSFRIWREGRWTEVLLMNFQILWKPEGKTHSRRVVEIGAEAIEAMQQGDLRLAEELLKQALSLEPDAPDLLNNLAALYAEQGRDAEARQILEGILEVAPGYLRAPLVLASLAFSEGNTTQARDLLTKVMRSSRILAEEFAILCDLEMRMAEAQGLSDTVQSWAGIWQRFEAEEPEAVSLRPPSLNNAKKKPMFTR